MIKSFFGTKEYRLWAWGGLIFLFLITWGQVYLTVLLNEWYGEFYNILQKANDIDAFWASMIKFTYIAIPYIFVAMFVFYFAQHYAFRWRQAITYFYLPLWEKCPHNIEGASQRIQQDTYELAKALESLGLGLFKAILTLIAFIPILWDLSSHITIPMLKDIEGSLVYIAFLTSVGGMVISYFVGIKLPGIEYDNQKVEATYRKQLVYSEEDKAYANTQTLFELFTGLRTNYFRMFNHYSYFSLWSNLYGQVMIILPYLVMAPSLFVGAITLGVVTQTGNAFGKVNDSFSYLIDHWTDITKFLSVIKRLREFEKLLEKSNKNIYILSDKNIQYTNNIPMIDIQYKQQNINLGKYDALIFTSKNGVKALDSIDKSWKKISSYVIAPQTAELLTSLGGIVKKIGKAHHGDKFAQEIIGDLQGKKVLYVSGAKTVSNLMEILNKNKVDCDSLVVYETVCKEYKNKIEIPKNSTIIFSSPSTIECFLKNVQWDASYTAISIGDTTAKFFPEYIKPVIADNTSLESCVQKALEMIK